MAVVAHSITTSKILAFHPGGCPTGVEPRTWRKALKSRVKMHLGVVTALLRLLDDMDGDVDLEDGADAESSLGGYELHGEVDLEADDCDAENTLEDDENELDLLEVDDLAWGEDDGHCDTDSGEPIPGNGSDWL